MLRSFWKCVFKPYKRILCCFHFLIFYTKKKKEMWSSLCLELFLLHSPFFSLYLLLNWRLPSLPSSLFGPSHNHFWNSLYASVSSRFYHDFMDHKVGYNENVPVFYVPLQVFQLCLRETFKTINSCLRRNGRKGRAHFIKKTNVLYACLMSMFRSCVLCLFDRRYWTNRGSNYDQCQPAIWVLPVQLTLWYHSLIKW